jgi:hypothetical protein
VSRRSLPAAYGALERYGKMMPALAPRSAPSYCELYRKFLTYVRHRLDRSLRDDMNGEATRMQTLLPPILY